MAALLAWRVGVVERGRWVGGVVPNLGSGIVAKGRRFLERKAHNGPERPDLMEMMLLPLKRYVEFQGRSTPKEYWMFFLFQMICVFGALIIVGMTAALFPKIAGAVGVILYLAFLLLWLPSLAVTIRRYHDQDKSGWMILISAIPLVGIILHIVFMCTDGTRGANRFGNDPKNRDVF